MHSKKIDFIVGVFIIFCIIVFVAVLLSISEIKELIQKPIRKQLVVLFRNISGLKKYDPVLYLGDKRGTVVDIDTITLSRKEILDYKSKILKDADFINELQETEYLSKFAAKYKAKEKYPYFEIPENEEDFNALLNILNQRETLIKLTLDVDKTKVKIRWGTKVLIDKSLTGITQVVIIGGAGDEIESPDLKIIGIDYQELSETVNKVSTRFNMFVSKLTEKIDEIAIKVNETLESVNRIVSDEESQKNIRETIRYARDTMKEINEMFSSKKSDVEIAIEDLKSAATAIKNATSEDKLKNLVDNISKAGENLNKGMEDVVKVIEKFDLMLEANTLRLERAMKNVEIATESVKTAMEELKRHPWRLMESPEMEKVEAFNIYEAARQYNEASSNLRKTIEELKIVMTKPQTPVNAAKLEELQRELAESMKKYKDAEEKFFNKLGGKK